MTRNERPPIAAMKVTGRLMHHACATETDRRQTAFFYGAGHAAIHDQRCVYCARALAEVPGQRVPPGYPPLPPLDKPRPDPTE